MSYGVLLFTYLSYYLYLLSRGLMERNEDSVQIVQKPCKLINKKDYVREEEHNGNEERF